MAAPEDRCGTFRGCPTFEAGINMLQQQSLPVGDPHVLQAQIHVLWLMLGKLSYVLCPLYVIYIYIYPRFIIYKLWGPLQYIFIYACV